MKTLVKGGHIYGAVNLMSRNARPFCHVLMDRSLLASFTPLWVSGATDWRGVDSEYKRPDGGVAHVWAGSDGATALRADESAIAECYLPGHITGWTNAEDRSGARYVLLLSTTTADEREVLWREGDKAVEDEKLSRVEVEERRIAIVDVACYDKEEIKEEEPIRVR
jgi:hypothetical protein